MSAVSPRESVISAYSAKSAVEKVEDYMKAESRLSHIEKPPPDEGESKGAYCWRLIRHCVRHAVDLVSKADIKDLIVGHGVHHRRRINHVECIKQVIYNKKTREYISTDGNDIHVFKSDGRKKTSFPVTEDPIDRLIFAPHVNLYVGWMYQDDLLMLMTPDFEVSSVSEAHGPILAAVYNENIGEVVTVGAGFLTSWVFRYGGRHLLPRKTTTEGLDPDDSYSLLVLEETASRSQKAYAAYGTSVAVFNLYEGKLLQVRKELHVRNITSLLFFNPLKYLVTAAKDGSIKVWDDKWHLQVVFVGHGGEVSALGVYPYGPVIMSASFDNTIRVWSLETCDEVDKVDVDEPVLSLITIINHDNFASVSSSHADLWKVQNIHQLHANIGHKVEYIKSTDHPEYPTRVLMRCRDSSIRILSPRTGDIITSLLGDPRVKVIDAAYAIEEDTMFVAYGNGDIIKCDTLTNPCRITGVWKCSKPQKACNYLLVYEYVITADIQSDTWGGMKRAIATKQIHTTENQAKKKGKTANRTLLLGGRKDGHICVFNWRDGSVEFEIEAHGHKGVISMIANSKSDQLISAGLDNIIKIWRLYPYAQESLAPLTSLYCAHTPVFMSIMRNKLNVAFQEHTNATYSVVMYNLERRNRHDHGPEDDHLDSITGLSGCNKLKLVASCSADGTIRIWNEMNNLVRILRLNAVPNSLAFCSQKGDILVGIGDHLHRIDHKDYLPKSYRFKMVSMQFPEERKEKPLPYDEELLNLMNRDDVRRLKAARSSFKFTHFVDILTQEESDEVMREKREREAAFSALEQRESELRLLKEGGLKAPKKVKPTAATKREAFEKYLKIFYDRPRVKLVEDDPYEAELKLAAEDHDDEPETYRSENGPRGFFPNPETARPDSEAKCCPTVRADGYVPNSVLVHLLWPNRKEEEQKRLKEESERWVPPTLDLKQLEQIANVKKGEKSSGKNEKHSSKKKRDGTFEDSPIFLDYSDEEEGAKEAPEEEYDDLEPPTSALASALMQKVEQKMERSPSPEIELPKPIPGQVHVAISPSDPTSPQHESPKPKREPKPRKPLVKFVTKPSTVIQIPDAKTPSPPPREPTPRLPTPPPPRPVTPLPDFISRHIGEEWFDHFFPGCSPENMEKPWTLPHFVSLLLPCLKNGEWRFRSNIIELLQTTHQEDGVPHIQEVKKTVTTVLSDPRNPPSCMDPYSKDVLVNGLRLLHSLNIWDLSFYCEVLTHFLEGDKDVRNLCIDLLNLCGMRDLHKHMEQELDSWEVWHLDEKERSTELRKMAQAWLDKWMSSFKMHLQDTIDRLKKGQNVHGRVMPGRGGRSRSDTSQVRGILKRPGVDIITEGDEASRRHVPSRLTPASSRLTPTSSGRVTVTFDNAPDNSTIDNATYIEAINYFIDMMTEKQLEVLRSKNRGSAERPKVELEAQKNTVLVLPKIPGKGCLVRLGETHTSKCRPRRETSYAVDLRLPPLVPRKSGGRDSEIFAMPPAINLPLKTVYMNPFPSPIDEFDFPHDTGTLLLTLKTTQKYFVPERSFMPTTQQEQY